METNFTSLSVLLLPLLESGEKTEADRAKIGNFDFEKTSVNWILDCLWVWRYIFVNKPVSQIF